MESMLVERPKSEAETGTEAETETDAETGSGTEAESREPKSEAEDRDRFRGNGKGRGLRDYDELALHQREQVLSGVEVGAREVVEHLLELPVLEHELERIELRRG